jgi:hypothetical protein
MHRVLVLAIASLCACTSDPSSADPVRTPTAASTPIETQPTPVSTTDGPEYFFAVASQTGVEHCPDGIGREWLDVQPLLGWTPTSGDASSDLDGLMDQPVLARGSAGPAPERPPPSIEPVPCTIPMQMRSDWVNTPRGIRARRTSRTSAGHFHLTSVRRLDELKLEAVGEHVVASFENPLPFALTGVQLRMHYEGCYGKPGTRRLESETATLQPGEVLKHEFPRYAEQDQPGFRKGDRQVRQHHVAALELAIAGGEGPAEAKVWADLAVSLAWLGVDFDCD